MNIKEIEEMYHNAIQKMNTGDFQGALEITNKIKELKNNFFISYHVSGLLIDIGAVLGEDLVREGIELLEKDHEEMIERGIPARNIYYSLANGYSDVFKFKAHKTPNYHFFKDTELDIAIKYYRKALEYENPYPELFINMGNSLDSSGRVIDALDYYQKALDLNSNHSMALGNKAMTLVNYARVSSDHQNTFLIEAYSLLSQSLELGVPPEAISTFSEYLQFIKGNFPDEKMLNSNHEFPGYKIETKDEFEKYLITYCLENKLYLNICNFCQKCDACIGDTALIKRMTVSLDQINLTDSSQDSFLRLSAYLNQIKQDYVTARFLLILSRYEKLNLNFVDKRVRTINTLDYSMYNVYIQFLKFAFKNIYDVLDKIAYFLNDYLELGFKEYQIDFRRIWYKGRDKKINEKIKNTENLSLNALFKIHKDLEEENRILKDIRNGITHRFIQVRMFCDAENDKIMTEETLVEHTLELARIVRNAIMYLLQFVNEEETKKNEKIADKKVKVGKLVAEDIPDNLKSDRHYTLDIN